MKIGVKKLACIVSLASLTLLHTLSAFANKVDKSQVILVLNGIRAGIVSIHPISTSSAQLLSESREIVNEAIINIDSRDVVYTHGYLNSLIADKNLVDNIAKTDGDGQAKIIYLLTSDLRLKFRYTKHAISAEGYSQFVIVTVTTRNARNLRVNYTALGYNVDYKKPDHQFLRLTTPANEEMVPGIYELWLTKDGSDNVIDKRIVEIDPGKRDNNIDF